jgi:branched-chain amino acid transport system substrate-binding protein
MTAMHLKDLRLGLAIVAVILGTFETVQAAKGIYIPLFTYRTGPFADTGIPYANGMTDYLNMLNERDGGVGGVRLIIKECETGFDTKRGVECYESVKGKDPAVITTLSTGITLQVIPKASVDKIPVFSMAYGLSASADGNLFPWVFNAPTTYWDGATAFIRHVADVEGGFDKLKSKKIGLVYLDAPYGREPIPLLRAVAQDFGVELKLYPVRAFEMENQSSLWLAIGRDRLDWVFLQGWGVMTRIAIEEAVKTRFQLDHLIGVWWSGGDDDARAAGAEAKGYSSLSINGVGQNYPAIQDILKYIVSKGRSLTPKDMVGENVYNRAVLNAALIAEAIGRAQQLTDKKQVKGEDVRRGFETLDITDTRWKEIGLPGFAAPIQLSCADHNGHAGLSLIQWDGTKWNMTVTSIQPMKEKVLMLIDSAAEEYVRANPGWPKRTEPCDKSS